MKSAGWLYIIRLTVRTIDQIGAGEFDVVLASLHTFCICQTFSHKPRSSGVQMNFSFIFLGYCMNMEKYGHV